MPIVLAATTRAAQNGAPPLRVVSISALRRLQQRHPQRSCRQRRRHQRTYLQRMPGGNVEYEVSQCGISNHVQLSFANRMAPGRGTLPLLEGVSFRPRGLRLLNSGRRLVLGYCSADTTCHSLTLRAFGAGLGSSRRCKFRLSGTLCTATASLG